MALLPGALLAPEAEVVVAKGFGRQIVGHYVPGTTRSQNVEDVVNDLTATVFARSAS